MTPSRVLLLALGAALAATAAVLLLRVLVAWAEPRMVFFPWRGVTATPADRGIPYRRLTIATVDGERLHAWLLERAPAAPSGGGRGRRVDADVLYLHGNGGNLSVWLDVLAALHARGLRVMAVDYRGYGLSTGAPSEEGLLRDTEAAVEAFRRLRRPGVPAAYWGRSLGATFAAYAAQLAPPDALILESPFPDKASVIRRDPVLRFFNLFARYRLPTVEYLQGYEGPLLVVHGDADRIIRYELGREVFARARGRKRMATIRGADHNDLHVVDPAAYWEAIEAFLESAGAAAPSPRPA